MVFSDHFLPDNYFSGIPENIGNLTFLTYLDLSENNFQGLTLLSSIGNLTSLSTLDLSDYYLNGSLPDFWVEPFLTASGLSVEYLRLSSNSWEYTISEQHFLNLTSLTSKSNLGFNVDSEWIIMKCSSIHKVTSLSRCYNYNPTDNEDPTTMWFIFSVFHYKLSIAHVQWNHLRPTFNVLVSLSHTHIHINLYKCSSTCSFTSSQNKDILYS